MNFIINSIERESAKAILIKLSINEPSINPKLRDVSFTTWIQPLKVYDVVDNTVYIMVNMNASVEYIEKKYGAAYNKEKFNETIMKRYGVKWFTQTDKLKHFSHTEEAEQKRYITSKRNGTLNTSKEENIIFKLLKVKFPDTICHYKDKKRYPFVCDFYIPSLDLFIEYQGSMFHNKRPYLGTEEDLKEVEDIKQKSEKRKQITGKQKTRYDSLIETWTVRDTLKRETAKKNELNYLEFFTFDEFIGWLNEQ